nr:MAG TPA: hypothetical protein [Caudoviricetes sp.]
MSQKKLIHAIKIFDRPSQAAFCDKLKHGYQSCYAGSECSWVSDCVLRRAWMGVLQNEHPAHSAD